MAKKFNQWLDEFVENGANPKDVTNWPENGGGGQGGSGSNYLMTIMDYYQVVGKHIDVDSLISLLEKYQVNLDAKVDRGDVFIKIELNTDYNRSINLGYDTCSGEPKISIFNLSLENLEITTTFRTILTANKEKIESFKITEDNIKNLEGSSVIDNIIINRLHAYTGEKTVSDYLTIQEALSIFK